MEKGFIQLSQQQSSVLQAIDPKQPWLLTIVKSACDVWHIKCNTYAELQEQLAKFILANFQKICYCNLEEPTKIHKIEWDGLYRKYSAHTVHKLTEL